MKELKYEEQSQVNGGFLLLSLMVGKAAFAGAAGVAIGMGVSELLRGSNSNDGTKEGEDEQVTSVWS